MRTLHLRAALAAAAALTPAVHADIVWTGAVSSEVFDEANWDLSNSTVTTIDQPNGAVDILVGSIPLVLAGESRGLELRTENGESGREVSVRVGDDGSILNVGSGTIGALMRQRNETVDPAIEALDDFAGQLAFQVNRVHSQGQGLSLRTAFTGSIEVADPTANLGGDLAYAVADSSVSGAGDDADRAGQAAEIDRRLLLRHLCLDFLP